MPDAHGMQMWLEILVIEIEADVAIELPVNVVAGITFQGAPDLLGRLGVAPEAIDAAAGTLDRRVDAELRTRVGEDDAVRVGEEVADAAASQDVIDPFDIAALRQPDPLRPATEMALEFPRADFDLRVYGVLIVVH